MDTQEEILETKGEIRKLNVAIEELETERRLATTEGLKISLGAQISAKTGLLTIEKQRLLHLEQQGEIHHIFPLSFPNILDLILCPFSFDISSSPIQVRQRRKVRGYGYYWNIGFYILMSSYFDYSICIRLFL